MAQNLRIEGQGFNSLLFLKMIEEIYKSNKDIDKDFKRSGKCNYKKCKAICCRFFHIGTIKSSQQKKYLKGFGFKIILFKGEQHIILEKPCKYLNLKTYKCKRHKTKPACCRQFPINDDSVYQLIQKKCSYKFADKKVEMMGI